MGISTDAILFYGFPLGLDEGEIPEEWEADWLSVDGDAEAFLKERGYSGGVEIGIHCSYDYPIYYAAAKETVARRGRVMAIADHDLEDTSKADKELDAFCKALGLPNQQYGWFLVSRMG